MNTCDTCQWWDHVSWSHVYDGDEHRKICGNAKVQDSGEDDGAAIHKSIDSSILTGPKFGCIHWSPK